jgi:hypothetical protein
MPEGEEVTNIDVYILLRKKKSCLGGGPTASSDRNVGVGTCGAGLLMWMFALLAPRLAKAPPWPTVGRVSPVFNGVLSGLIHITWRSIAILSIQHSM